MQIAGPEKQVKNGGQLPAPLPVQNPIVKDDQINKDNADRLAQMSRTKSEAERQEEVLARLVPTCRQSCIIGEHIFYANIFLHRFFTPIFLRQKLSDLFRVGRFQKKIVL